MIPTEKELLDFIKKNKLVNYSAIAKNFNIKNATVTDLIASLEKKGVVEVKKLGGSNIVLIR